ncbi:MAG TPA: universal stress protein [Puia sp.]|nr:universal stress protein [Puia sp.]
MTKLFKDIMVPFFSIDELDSDAERAIEIAKQLQSNIHLLYMSRDNKISMLKKAGAFLSNRKRIRTVIESDFLDLHKKRLIKLYPSLFFHCAEGGESQQHSIIDYCNKNNIDLVLFIANREPKSREKKNNNLNIGSLSEKLGCPVISVNFKTNMLHIKNIVIPIGSFLPMKRLIVGCYIGRLFNSKIHLVSLNKKFLTNGRDEAVCMYKAYHLLRDNTNLPVECITLMSKNIDEAAFRYADEINADLVFVNSESDLISPEMMN